MMLRNSSDKKNFLQTLRAKKATHFLFLCLAIFSGCKELDELVVSTNNRATIPGGSPELALDMGLALADFTHSEDQAASRIEEAGARPEQIDAIRLGALRLALKDAPAGQDFTFIKSLELYISADGLPERRIAVGGPFEDGNKEVDLDVDDVEIRAYLLADSMELRTLVEGRQPKQELDVKVEADFIVDVDIQETLCGG